MNNTCVVRKAEAVHVCDDKSFGLVNPDRVGAQPTSSYSDVCETIAWGCCFAKLSDLFYFLAGDKAGKTSRQRYAQ